MTLQRPAPEVSVLIVTFNSVAFIDRCLRSIDQTADGAEVVIVDNASTDGSLELLRSWAGPIRLVDLHANLGFAAAVNLAARYACGRYLLLLNPDAALLPGSLDVLLDFANRHPAHGIYGGRVVTPGGAVDRRSCFGLPTPWSLFCFGSGLSAAGRGLLLLDPESLGRWSRDSVREVGAVSGALMLVDRRLWQRLGGFDETYFMYSEDVDLCARARRLGARPVVVPGATAVHAVGASSTAVEKAVMLFTGKATYVRQRWRPPARWWGIAMLRAGVGLRALLSRWSRRDRAEVWRALWGARGMWIRGYVCRSAEVDVPWDER